MLDAKQVLSVVEQYTVALDMLDDYDHQRIGKPKGNATTYVLTYEECKDVYPSVEEKAANFLYFLDKNGMLMLDGNKIIEDYTLVAITIMIAESKPEEKRQWLKLHICFCRRMR